MEASSTSSISFSTKELKIDSFNLSFLQTLLIIVFSSLVRSIYASQFLFIYWCLSTYHLKVKDFSNKLSCDLNNSESSIELLDGFSLLLGDHFLELDLALGTSLESSHQLAELLVVVEVSPEG